MEASQEQIIQAAKRAHVHETISSFPDGYDTMVGERGMMISGGEKQRLAVSRLILKDPPLLFFDEAVRTSISLSKPSTNTVRHLHSTPTPSRHCLHTSIRWCARRNAHRCSLRTACAPSTTRISSLCLRQAVLQSRAHTKSSLTGTDCTASSGVHRRLCLQRRKTRAKRRRMMRFRRGRYEMKSLLTEGTNDSSRARPQTRAFKKGFKLLHIGFMISDKQKDNRTIQKPIFASKTSTSFDRALQSCRKMPPEMTGRARTILAHVWKRPLVIVFDNDRY